MHNKIKPPCSCKARMLMHNRAPVPRQRPSYTTVSLGNCLADGALPKLREIGHEHVVLCEAHIRLSCTNDKYNQ
jgi:hypothetical protein